MSLTTVPIRVPSAPYNAACGDPLSALADLKIRCGNASCQFLRLAGEIRNIIYAYALTNPDEQVVVYEDLGPLMAAMKADFADISPTERRACLMSTPFANKVTLFTDSSCVTEANQLRFVNRQLYYETRGLTLRYNNLSFEHSPTSNNQLLRCTRFLHHCGEATHRKIKGIIVKSDPEDNTSCYRSTVDHSDEDEDEIVQSLRRPTHPLQVLDRFCTAHPDITFKWHLIQIEPCIRTAIHLVIGAQAYFKRDIPWHLYGTMQGSVYAQSWWVLDIAYRMENYTGKHRNLRIFPVGEEKSYLQLKKMIEASERVMEEVVPFVDNGVDRLVQEIQSWYRDGV